MFFGKKQKPPQTPYGEGRFIGESIAVDWIRWNGVLLTLDWPKDTEPDQAMVLMIKEGLDAFVLLAIDHLGFREFPPELRTLVPDTVSILPADSVGTWSLSFRCPEWEDAIWGVDFRDGEIVRDFHGD